MDFSLVGNRGTTIGYRYPVKLAGVDYDITQPGVILTFTVKRKRTDADPLIQKTWRATHPPANDAGMSNPDNHTLEIDLLPADTAAFTQAEFLLADIVLTEPDQRKTTIAQGAVTVRRGVGT